MAARMTRLVAALGLVAAVALAAPAVVAGETEIGESVEVNGVEVAALYLQPVLMSPQGPHQGPSDIHLEADIHATRENVHGFGAGDWIPYLEVSYRIGKLDSEWSAAGSFVPMVANDGPHYGDNVALDGPGRYELTYRVSPPVRGGLARHTDKETGVPEWWSPFEASWTFTYFGTGKKGGY